MTSGSFDSQTTAEQLSDTRWRATLGSELSGFGGIHGGYVMALALRTMSAIVAHADRTPRSLSCHLLAPVKPGAVELIAGVDRDGGSTTSTSLRIEQDGALVATALGSHGKPHRSMSLIMPRRRSSASAPGLRLSPHSLSRGNVARSTMSTRTPARASTVAATLPAGPPPTITMSGAPTGNELIPQRTLDFAI